MPLPAPAVGNNDLTAQGVRVVVVTSVMSALVTIFVIARIWSRYVNLPSWKLAIEDWLIVGALLFTWGYIAGSIICKAHRLP